MDKDELIDSVGVHINHINTDDFFQKITRLSELGENWFIPSKCPKCGRYIEFSKQNINQVFTCKCGQKICCQISDDLI